MKAIVVAIVITEMKIGNNSKWGHEEKYQTIMVLTNQ